jgi:hypothetical protein
MTENDRGCVPQRTAATVPRWTWSAGSFRAGDVLAPQRPPWRFGRLHLRARFVVELPAGTVQATGTELGDRVGFEGYGP